VEEVKRIKVRVLNKKEEAAQKRIEKIVKKKELARIKEAEKEKKYIDIKAYFEVDDDENDKNYKNRSVRTVTEEYEGRDSVEIL
jgi:hypothetical protein